MAGEKLSGLIDERTKTPMVWIFIAVIAAAGGILYIADMRSEIRIHAVEISALEKRQDEMQLNVKDELREIKKKLDELIESRRR
jgi:predicted Holliday junction resolvase-like endonuclease